MKFLGPLNMKYLGPGDPGYTTGRTWQVLEPFEYAVGCPASIVIVRCPIGQITDFASIPRILWSWLPPTGWYGKAAVLHDELYSSGLCMGKPCTRKFADGVLFEAMRVLEAEKLLDYGARQSELRDWLDRRIIYWGVRLGGWIVWRNYRKTEVGASKVTT